MNKNIEKQSFATALNFLIKRKGRGSIAAIARTIGMDATHLSNIANGKTPGPPKKRRLIAEYFALNYDEILSLGQWISGGYPGEIWVIANSLDEKRKIEKIFLIIALYFLNLKKGTKFKKQFTETFGIRSQDYEKILKGDISLLEQTDQQQLSRLTGFDINSLVDLGRWIFSGNPVEDWLFDYIVKNIDNKKSFKLNTSLLAKIIASIDNTLDENNYELSAKKKSNIISIMYEKISQIDWSQFETESDFESSINNNKDLKMLLELAI